MIEKTSNFVSVIKFLKQNLIINLNIIGIIENEPSAEVFVDNIEDPTGVFVQLDYFHYMYTENDAFVEEVIKKFFNKPGWYGFSGLYKPIADKIRGRFENTWESCCDIYYLPSSRVSQIQIKNIVTNVKIDDAEVIDRLYTYRNEGSLDMIKKDIQNRPSSAIYNDKEIASWVLVHNDNSMGIMYTKDEFRNKGYAVDVTLDLTSKIIKMGKIPYLQINKLNNMSPGLALKCGFDKYEECDWFGFVVGTPKEIEEGSKESKDKFIEAFSEEKKDIILEEIFLNSLGPIGMHMFLMNMKEDNEEVPSFIVEKVKDLEQIKLWTKIAAKSNNLPYHEKEELEDLIGRVVSSEKYLFNLYIGFLNGEPVSTIAVQRIDNWNGGICFLSVIQSSNKQSIYYDLIRIALKREQSEGRELVYIHTSEELTGILKKIGFR